MPAVTASLTQPLLKCCGPNLPFHNKCLYGAVGCRSARSPRQLVVHVGNSAALKLSCNVAARQPNGMKQFCLGGYNMSALTNSCIPTSPACVGWVVLNDDDQAP